VTGASYVVRSLAAEGIDHVFMVPGGMNDPFMPAMHEEIPEPVQSVLIDAVGAGGVVELVALCGLYGLIGYMTTAFAIAPEPGLPALP
jgi:hypothetical protein